MGKNTRYVIILPGVILILVFLLQAGRVNLLALRASHLELRKPEGISAIDANATGRLSCRGEYFMGILLHNHANLNTRDSEWAQAIACDKRVVVFLHRRYPEDSRLAELSAAANPDSAEAWFWLGDLKPDAKISFYQRGLALDQLDAWRWLELGRLLEQSGNQVDAAIQAYLQACLNGEPGQHGCAQAAGLTLSSRDIQGAINIYRMSLFERNLKKAEILENSLQASPTP